MQYTQISKNLRLPSFDVDLSSFANYGNFVTAFRTWRNQQLVGDILDYFEMKKKLEGNYSMWKPTIQLLNLTNGLGNIKLTNLDISGEIDRIVKKLKKIKAAFPRVEEKNSSLPSPKQKTSIIDDVIKKIKEDYQSGKLKEKYVPIKIQIEYSVLEFQLASLKFFTFFQNSDYIKNEVRYGTEMTERYYEKFKMLARKIEIRGKVYLILSF